MKVSGFSALLVVLLVAGPKGGAEAFVGSPNNIKEHRRTPTKTTTTKTTTKTSITVLESSPRGSGSSPSSVPTTTQSGPPLPYGGDLVPRNKDRVGFEAWPEAIREFILNFDIPSLASLKETWTIILQENVLGKSNDGKSKGEAYFAVQVLILTGILTGSIPVIGGVLNFVAGPCLLTVGVAIMGLTASRLGPGLSPWPVPNENTELVTTGLYAYVRHPMYAGLLASTIGFSIWTGSALRLALTLVLWYVLHQKTQYEEEALIQKFGVEYVTYQQQVPDKIIPREGAILGFLPGWDTKNDNINMY